MDQLEKAQKRFYGHDKLFSKYEPKIPASAEREYVRMTNQYMKLLKDELNETLPELRQIYKEELKTTDEYRMSYHADSMSTLMMAVNRIFQKMAQNLSEKMQGYGLRRRLENMANLNRKLTIKEWKRAVKNTLGIDIREDYYMGDFYKEQMEQWISDNVDLIKTIPSDSLDKMKEIVLDGYTKGDSTKSMIKRIMEEYGKSKRKAKFIARDQTAKLNGNIAKAQQEDAGITQYKWSTSGDERVRASHAELNGKVFDWANPPTNSDGRTCHPGEDYNCRCCAIPIFNTQLKLPIDGIENKEMN